MEKFTIDEMTYVKVFKAEDFQDNQTTERFIKQCEQIIKSYKGSLDTEEEINKFNDETTNFFIQELKSLAFVIYSKVGCEPSKAKPVGFTFFSAEENSPQWHLELIYKKLDSDSKFSKLLVQTAFDYLKLHNAEKITSNVENSNEPSLRFFEKLINSGLIDGHIYKSDDAATIIKNANTGYDVNDIESEIDEDYYYANSVIDVTEFEFDLKSYKPEIIKNEQIQE